ncbi:MAG: ZIP family metal transporter [Saprospiraceae bacterium]|nr:ZIP family metal transporter [Saprospiraceae bacterium]
MAIWQYIALFLTVLAGGGLALQLKKYNPANLRLVLSFSGSYILGISILHLMPGVYAQADTRAGLWILLGFFIQLLLEQLSKGIEHGHVHVHEHGRFAYSIMLGLCLHAFIEGLPLSNYTEFHQLHHGIGHDDNHLFYGIILHKAPAAFALAILLLWSKAKLSVIWISLTIFAAMSPLGAFIASLFKINLEIVTNLVALVIGSFLHISTTILFEADDSHQHRIAWKKMIVILAGLSIAILTL